MRMSSDYVKEKLLIEKEKAAGLKAIASALESLTEAVLQHDIGQQLVIGRALQNIAGRPIRRGK